MFIFINEYSLQELYRTPVKRLNFINNAISLLSAIRIEEEMAIKRKVNEQYTNNEKEINEWTGSMKLSWFKENVDWKDRWNKDLGEWRKGMWSILFTKDKQVAERVGN